jgi:hypothetical protein
MVFGRCFETALRAYFRGEDPSAVLFKEWACFATLLSNTARAIPGIASFIRGFICCRSSHRMIAFRFPALENTRFPESRRKAYYLMAIHENLTKVPKPRLKAMGWSKAVEMVKVARKGGESFDCATWLHKADALPKEEFKREVEKHLTDKESEPWELIYFKIYKSQVPVIERALETAGPMLGNDKSGGYMLEMICADFLAGVNLETADSKRLGPFSRSALCTAITAKTA